MKSRLAMQLLLAGVVLGANGAEAQLRYLCFGDSITLGNYDDEYDVGHPAHGYPGRLAGFENGANEPKRLDCPTTGCEVINKGKSGEKTPAGLTRIDNVLNNNPSDVLLLMEGTNDIFVEYDFGGDIWSKETMVFNLKQMAKKAESRGTDAVHASIIWFHPDGDHGTSKNGEVEYLRDEMQSASATENRYFVDIWNVLCPVGLDVHGDTQAECFDLHYPDVPADDDRGHPNGSGYDMVADEFYNVIVFKSPPKAPVPVSPSGSQQDSSPVFVWNRETPRAATWYQFQLENGSGTIENVWLKMPDYCVSGVCTYDPGIDLSIGSYSWRVRGRNPNDKGPWSADKSFTYPSQVFSDGFESGNTSAWSASLP